MKYLFVFSSFFLFGFICAQKEKEVKVNIHGETMYGTLTSVSGGTKAPVVIIIQGSGPTDRNGISGIMQMNTYRMLAESLAEHGIASLRYDKLMIGKSQTKNLKEENLTFENNTEWVLAWVDFLAQKKYQHIILVGHSEGSLIGMLAAQQGKVDKYISLEGAGRPIDEILYEQISAQSEELGQKCKPYLDKLKTGELIDVVPKDLEAIFRKSVQPYLISWMKYDPKIEIAKLDIPTLIVQGSTDIQVTTKDSERLAEGTPNAQYVLINGMSHILKDGPEERTANILTYYNPKLPLNKDLIDTLIRFIQ